MQLYNEVKFDNAFTFVYSKRDGTAAALIPDEIPLSEKKERLQQLNELVKVYAKQNNEKFVNKILDVLVDGPSKKDKSIISGYSPQWKVVNFKGDAKPGEIVKVFITSASLFTLNGEMAK